ncbi:hypothetical protein [Mangrovicoccus algicola]|uniref:Uncharacterized protein n=1 Tax=Mangrovicoccus algicola TaxID=2771008 RepID=A0A8J6YVX4_9RHOB|nr:hypothetical protein [Mangrovicoccus algicola]MBE3637043.1 hypothetical protein [Mangrovicoccus algicola]
MTMPPEPPEEGPVLPCDLPHSGHRPFAHTRFYDDDDTGLISYRFNSAGFRGEEYRPDARLRICVIGACRAFGTGIHQHLTYGARLGDHLATALELPREEVNVLNLSVGRASGDYVTRMLLTHVPLLAPDLVLLGFPAPQRMEYFGAEGFESYDLATVPRRGRQGLPAPLAGFRDLYNPDLGRIAMARNILMAQGLMEHARIPYAITTEHLRPNLRHQPQLAPFLAALDDRFILRHRHFHLAPDRAAHDQRGGPAAHGALAIALLPLVAAQFDRLGEEEAVARITALSGHLKETDLDWLAARDAILEARAARAARTG